MPRLNGRSLAVRVLVFGFLLLPASAFAQAALEVTVYHQQTQQPLAGVEVLVENPQTSFNAKDTTNAQGKARFAALSTAGSYRVRVAESTGFYEMKSESLTLRSNFERSVSLALVPRTSVSEAVTVTAGGVAEVNATNAEVSSTLSPTEIVELPVEGRDITRALYRLPNVTQATGFYAEAPNVSVNGANSLYTSYLVDGLDNNENFLGGQKFALPVGFTQGITVLTNNYSSEFGRAANGIFNITSRSGGNATGGEVFFLTRPGASVDASSPFFQRDLSGNSVKDGFQRFQGGFSLGGPVVKDRIFYFVNAEYTRDIKDNLLNSPELGVNETVRGHNKTLFLSGKLDDRVNEHWNASLRANVGLATYERQGGGLEGGVNFPSAANGQDRNSVLLAGKAFYTGARFVSETSLQYSRFRWNYANPANPSDPQTVVQGPSGSTIGVLGNPGYVFDDTENTIQAQEKATFQKGRHSIRVGGELLSADFALSGGGNPNGNYTVQLTSAQEAEVRAKNLGSSLGVHDIPSDAHVLDYNVEMQPKAFGKRQNVLGFYVEDVVSVDSRLNLTLGLRYDYDNLSKGGAASGDTNNFAPRAAFNYRLGDGSTVRGGYGLYYDKVLYAYVSDALQQGSTSAGFRSQLERLITLGILPADTDLDRATFDGNLSADFSSVPYLGGPTSAEVQAQRDTIISGELRILNPNRYPNPKTHQLTLGYQKQLGRHYLAYVDLIHSRAEDLPRIFDLNAPSPYPIDPNHVVVRTPDQANATRPVGVVPGGARGIIVTQNAGRARYYGASLNLVKERGSERYGYRLSYTLSQLENDTDDINFRAQDSNNFAADYGPSLNDRRHVINAIAYLYPARDLSVSVAGLVQSGQPINRIPDAQVFGTTDLNGDGRSFGDAYDGNSDRWPGAPRNGDRLPWAWTIDMGLQYGLHVGKNRLELRADAFNLLNHVNLSGFSNNATQSNQIQIGPPGGPVIEKNAAPPRQLQLGVRFVF